MEDASGSPDADSSAKGASQELEPGIKQFVLLSLEAWERLHSLDRLLESEHTAKSYYNLLHKKAGHSRRLTYKKFKATKLLFGPQALALLLPVLGFLQKLDDDSQDDCEAILEEAGIGLPSSYDAELRSTSPEINGSIRHPRRQMIRCIRNAASHHMENSLSLRGKTQGIGMSSDGRSMIMSSDSFLLSFEKKMWQMHYVRLLHDLGRAARRILK